MLKNRIVLNMWLLVLVILLLACNGEEATLPKPRLYPKITFPERGYKVFQSTDCPFTLEYPSYAIIESDEYFEDKDPIHPCWFDILMKGLNASIHCSYIPINGSDHFDELVSDAFRLVTEHNIKAEARQDSLFTTDKEAEGILFSISGDVATPIQWMITDSTTHFMRASLYFDDQVNADSIAPILSFVRTDIDHLIESFNWQ